MQPDGGWESYDCNQLYEEVRKDELYFLASCGGVTFGGGEPLLQSEFIRQFRQLCGPEWRITVETSLNVPQQNVEELISIIDNYIVDIKDMNNNIYQRYTGKNNENVLYDCLVKEFGVPEATLNVAYEGGVDNMFYDDPRLSRAVITEAK